MKKALYALLLLLLVLLPVFALGEEAAEVTQSCTLQCGSQRTAKAKMLDRNYRTYWESTRGKGASIVVEMPKGKTCGFVSLQWYETPLLWQVETEQDGGWQTIAKTDGAYYSDALALPEGVTRFRIRPQEGVRDSMRVAEIRVYERGEKPASLQMWLPTVEKADLMLVACHPDDEVLWFGGALPTYAGQQGKRTLVCILVPAMPYRRLELLDCLWTCGVTTYPVWGGLADKYSVGLQKQYSLWNETRLQKMITQWVRQYKPEVLLTHDLSGEYGHGGHRVCADLCVKALKWAANEAKFPESARAYGTWQVKKLYLHLYGENVVDMDWDQPLSAFGGLSGLEVAREAFLCHVSQQHTDYRVRDSGSADCSLFGLYYSAVGPDLLKNDFFENLSYEVDE